MSGPAITAKVARFPVAGKWTISRDSITEVVVVVAEARMSGKVGRGECRPYPRYGWTPEGVVADIEAAAAELAGRTSPEGWALAEIMPANAARNALDCALWDLRARIEGRRVWEIAGVPEPRPVVTAYSLSLDTPEAMLEKARANAHRPLLKVKLGGGGDDLERIRSVREGAPRARIIVDANEGWTAESYTALAPEMVGLGVAMVEQPLPEGADDVLSQIDRPLPVCADESCHDRSSLPALRGKYDMINIKLDKTGGLTEALALKVAAEAEGFQVMVGSMLCSSLAIAPATLVAQGAEIADLDGPLLLAADVENPIRYDDAGVHPPARELWG